jgi:hypothetical protein
LGRVTAADGGAANWQGRRADGMPDFGEERIERREEAGVGRGGRRTATCSSSGRWIARKTCFGES